MGGNSFPSTCYPPAAEEHSPPSSTTTHKTKERCRLKMHLGNNSPNVYMCSGQSGDASCLHAGRSADWPAHLPTVCPVYTRDLWQIGCHICEYFVPSPDENVGKLDNQSANISRRNGDQSVSAFCPTILGTFYPLCNLSCMFFKFLFFVRIWTLELFEEFCERVGGPKGKVINKLKVERIIKALAEGHQVVGKHAAVRRAANLRYRANAENDERGTS